MDPRRLECAHEALTAGTMWGGERLDVDWAMHVWWPCCQPLRPMSGAGPRIALTRLPEALHVKVHARKRE